MLEGAELSAERIAAEVGELIAAAGEDLPDAEPEVVYEMRYAGQAFELPVPGPPDPDPADLVERFERAHEELYGHRDPDGEVVLVHIGVAMVSPGPRAAAGAPAAEPRSRKARAASASAASGSRRRCSAASPRAGTEAEGPVVFELPEATFVVPPGWSARVDERGHDPARRHRERSTRSRCRCWPGGCGRPATRWGRR